MPSSSPVALYDFHYPLTPQTRLLNMSHRLHGACLAKVVCQQLFYSVLIPHKFVLPCEGYGVAELMPTLNKAVKPLGQLFMIFLN